jgi:hypothetical protein
MPYLVLAPFLDGNPEYDSQNFLVWTVNRRCTIKGS